ncbi:unnamed protein product [Arabidopsis thaliana]|uniref:RING-type E3 ubiquitin transferase n=1 Tax=Arabidopsis thaliana TaxID=3702 RepID=A0A5S9X6F8_ARATH|nr:unnamed protein product [Arabidopsis thaliana]CAD5321139.1 unnamed protein product [Arabidopsis thaliana]
MSSNNKTDDSDDRSFWQNSTSYDASSKIFLVTTVSFSIIIIIVFVYYLYAKFVLHRRSAFQDLSFSVVSQPPKRGLDSLVIASLPTFVVGIKNDVAGTECAVCLSLLEEKDNARMLPNCKHVFHVSCVDTWLTTQSTCPVCRTEAEPSHPRLEPEPREGPVGDFAPPLDFAGVDNKTGGSSVSRLDSFRRILTRERSSNRRDHSRVDQDRELDIERE